MWPEQAQLSTRPEDKTQPIRVQLPRRKRRVRAVRSGLLLGLVIGCYLFFPRRINVLLLGIDRSPEGTAIGRSDTLILTTAKPLSGYFGLLSIPRDLWVTIPGVGEGRINTAHFFAEAETLGSGPELSIATVAHNFGLQVDYYARISFEGFRTFVDALGGVPIEVKQPMEKLPAGPIVLDGEQALAFVRDRSVDDFTRMHNGQEFMRALLMRVLNPGSWVRLPQAFAALAAALDTNMPPWVLPRYAFAWLRASMQGMDSRIISREMVQGFVTDSGAQVLAPDWSRINPLLFEIFGE